MMIIKNVKGKITSFPTGAKIIEPNRKYLESNSFYKITIKKFFIGNTLKDTGKVENRSKEFELKKKKDPLIMGSF